MDLKVTARGPAATCAANALGFSPFPSRSRVFKALASRPHRRRSCFLRAQAEGEGSVVSTSSAPAAAAPSNGSTASATTKPKDQDFMDVYQVLRSELLDDPLLGPPFLGSQPEFARNYVAEMLDYNVPGGKLNRGKAVADALIAVKGPEATTKEDIFNANVLGWCIEWFQAFWLVSDDIIDNAVTRRGQPCWFRMPSVGYLACNDYIVLESCIYRILSRHFRDTPIYTRLLDLFHESTHQTAHGQMLDVTLAPVGTVDLSRYTLTTYLRIVTFKTAYYSFYLPTACGMLLGGITDQSAFDLAKDICIQMGQYFQIQDDYLDCFGDPEVIGKVGTDIQDNKCSWLVVQALQRATPAQKSILEANYGKDDEAAIAAVKALYNDLDLEQVFKQYEQDSYEKLQKVINGQSALPPALFTSLLAKIYKRSK